jgi:hypothetical protein
MSMDLCYMNRDQTIESLLNCSNINHGRFVDFVSNVLKDDLFACQCVVDSQSIVMTDDENYNEWLLKVAAEEEQELLNAQALYTSWDANLCNITDAVEAMGVAMMSSYSSEFRHYISSIITGGARALLNGNPRVYWA